MKKETLLILLIFLAIQLASAKFIPLSTTKFLCSDNSTVEWDQKEIKIGDSKFVGGIGIAVTASDEINAISRITADLIIDAQKLLLKNSSQSEEIELLTGKYTVTQSNVTETGATITVGGTKIGLLEKEVGTANNLFVYLSSSEETGENAPKTEVIVGAKQIFLSNNANPLEKHKFGNTTFMIELFSAGDTGATIKVSKCKTGEIQKITNTTGTQDNETNETTTNETQLNGTEETPEVNRTSCVDLLEELQNTCCQNELNNENSFFNKEKGECELSTTSNTQSDTNQTQQEEQDKKPDIIKRIINWLKKLLRLP